MKIKKKKFSLTCVKEMKIAFYIMLWYFSCQPKKACIHMIQIFQVRGILKNFIIQEKYVIIASIIYVSKQNSELD